MVRVYLRASFWEARFAAVYYMESHLFVKSRTCHFE